MPPRASIRRPCWRLLPCAFRPASELGRAVEHLRVVNRDGRRKLGDAPVGFLAPRWRRHVLPPPTRPDTEVDVGDANLFATLPEYQVFGSLFDIAFLVTAVLTAIVRWFSHRINSVGVIED